MKWRFLCKCGDGSAFFEHKVTGELMNWWIDKGKLTISARRYFNCTPINQEETK
jgi:hypothetical protein